MSDSRNRPGGARVPTRPPQDPLEITRDSPEPAPGTGVPHAGARGPDQETIVTRRRTTSPRSQTDPVRVLAGPVTVATSNTVLHTLLRAAAQMTPGLVLIVDLSEATQLDAAGVGVLCTARARARMQPADLALTGVPDWAVPVLRDAAPAGDPLLPPSTDRPGTNADTGPAGAAALLDALGQRRPLCATHPVADLLQHWVAWTDQDLSLVVTDLDAATTAQGLLGRARGVLRARYRLSPDQAARRLLAMAQAQHRTVAQTAAALVEPDHHMPTAAQQQPPATTYQPSDTPHARTG